MIYPRQIGDKEYTRQQLLDYGIAHYPKFYWIPRGIGIASMVSGLLVVLPSIMGILYLQDIAREFETTIDYTELIVYLILGIIDSIIGIVLFIISFRKKADEDYIAHAIAQLSKVALAQQMSENMQALSPKEEKEETPSYDPKLEELKKYKKLLDEGLISQEVYDAKQREYLGSK